MISRENQLSICPNIRYGCSANSKIIQIKIDANFLFQSSKCQILNPFVLLFRRSACSYSGLLQSGISKRCSLPPVCKECRRQSRLRRGEQTHTRPSPALRFSFPVSLGKIRPFPNNCDHDQVPHLWRADILSSRCETQKHRNLLLLHQLWIWIFVWVLTGNEMIFMQ